MARKPTLKSLLGTSDGRVQTELNLGTPRLSATVAPTGSGSAYVTRAPQSNLSQLADALGGLNNKLAQYNQGKLQEQEMLAKIEGMKANTALTNKKLDFVKTQSDFETFASEQLHTFVAERKEELYKTEDELDRIFKDEYALNPLNVKRAQALAGAELRSDFLRHVEEGLVRVREDMINGTGEPLSQDQVNGLVDDLIDGFVSDNNISGSVLNGLYSATENDRIAYKSQLPTQLQEYHQDNVIIPRVTTALMDIVEGDIENNLHVNGQLVPNRQSTPSRINETLRLAQGLPPEKLLKMMENIENTIDLEDAALGVTTFQQVAAQLKIGNQSYVDTADYQRLAAQLEDKVEKYEAQQNTLFNTRVATHQRNQDPTVDRIYTLKGKDGGVSGVEAYRQSEIERINKIEDPMERKAELEALDKSINGIMVRHDQAIKDISEQSSYNIEGGYSNEAVVDIATRVGNELNDVSEGGVINSQNTGLFRTDMGYTVGDQTFTPEAQKVYDDQYDISSEKVHSLKNEIARRVLIGEIDATEGGALLTEGMRAIHEQFQSGVRQGFHDIINGKRAEIEEEERQEELKAVRAEKVAEALTGIVHVGRDFDKIDMRKYPTNIFSATFRHDTVVARLRRDWSATVEAVSSGLVNPDSFMQDGKEKSIDMLAAREQVVPVVEVFYDDFKERFAKVKARSENGVVGALSWQDDIILKNYYEQNTEMRAFLGYDPHELSRIMQTADPAYQGRMIDSNGFKYAGGTFQDPTTFYIKGVELPEYKQFSTLIAQTLGITYETLLENQAQFRKANFIRD